MSAQASYFRLGLFVLVAIGLLVASVIVLGAGSWFKEGIMVETYVTESVAGLNVGSPVKMYGVQIGQVKRIGFVTARYEPKSAEERIRFNRYIYIDMEVDPELLPAISNTDSQAMLAKNVEAGMRFHLQSSLTGPTYVDADYVDPNVHKPPKIDWEPEYLYVPSARGTMAQVTSAVERLAAQIEKAEFAKVVDNVNTLVVDTNKAINQLQVGEINKEILLLGADMRAILTRLDEVIGNPAIDKGINDLGKTIAGLKDVVVSSKDSVKTSLADLPKITARLTSTAEEIDKIIKSPETRRTLAGLANTAENAGPAMISLRKTAQRLDNLLASQQRDIESIIIGLRKTMANITTLSEDAAENPSRVIFGSPPPKTKPGEK